MGNGGGLDMGEGADAPYLQMLDDIQSAISYLQSHAGIYHINPEKIALMGHSAGGHLALLYAYKAAKCAGCTYNDICPNVNLPEDVYCDKHKVSPAIPIELVISEAGPTYFVSNIFNELPSSAVNEILAMAGTTRNDSNLDTKLTNASPYTYANSSHLVDTILVYCDDYDTFGSNGDRFVKYSQCETLKSRLENNYTEYEASTEHTNFGTLIDDSQYLMLLSSAFSTLKTN